MNDRKVLGLAEVKKVIKWDGTKRDLFWIHKIYKVFFLIE